MKHSTRLLGVTLACAVACGLLWLLLEAAYPLLREGLDSTAPRQPTFRNRDMTQWLQALRWDTNSGASPLAVDRVTTDRTSGLGLVQIPMRYDLVIQNGLSQRNGKFDLLINKRTLSSTCWSTPDGKCALPFGQSELAPGTNEVAVIFIINNPSDIDRILLATGPVSQVVITNVPSPR